MTDTTGAVVWQASLRPFGETEALFGTATNDQRFPGQRLDAETGLHQNGFRDYDPSLGRYLQADPIGLAGGLNPYAYAGGNPVNLVDPDGLSPWANKPLIDLISDLVGHLFPQDSGLGMVGPPVIPDNVSPVTITPGAIENLVQQCRQPEKNYLTKGQVSLRKKIDRVNQDKFSQRFGLQRDRNPAQADVDRVLREFLSSPDLTITPVAPQGGTHLFSGGGYKIKDPTGAGVALDPQLNFKAFLN